MAERPTSRRRGVPRSASTESSDVPMGKPKERKHHKKPKERWLLTRKTWRYMADAGRKLIPEGVQNRPEDIPKIEAYFQEMCKKEPKFLLWRKNSYPGALGFRSRKRKERRKGGSCRKASSADEIEILRPERPTNLPLPHTSGSRFDIQKMKEDFLNKPPTPSNYSPFSLDAQPSPSAEDEDPEEKQLISMIEQYLSISSKPNAPSTSSSRTDLNYQELVDKLQRHLTLISRNFPQNPPPPPKQTVHFEGDYVQKSLSETLSRYFGMYPNRDKVISDLLTDRRALERLYFDLRQAKGFRSRRGGTGYQPGTQGWSPKLRSYGNQRSGGKSYENRKDYYIGSPPPLIEIHGESTETTYRNFGTQTLPIPEEVLVKVEEEFKKSLAEKEEEERENTRQQGVLRRKSSVDHDDVSQSVSETIKRYLRMARKKSVDTDKVDRFKRVNYDRNLRNIKAKGEITKPGDDDGLNKGCQTNDDWILTYRDLKFNEITGLSDNESRISSSRSSIDAGVDGDPNKSSPSSPPGKVSSSHSFFSNLLHHRKHHDKHEKNATTAAIATGAMQKSKSSSSVMHHGSRLVAKKIFRSRSKSQTRPSSAPSSWTPQGGCVWSNVTGRQVVLTDTTLLNLTEVERKVLQKVALARLQALNLGVAVKIPSENVGAVAAKPKKRPYLLKRRALTTSIFDTNREKDGKDGASTGGLVFGIPLTQCVENDRLSRAAAGTSPFRSRGELSGSNEEPVRIGRHGSRASFSSLFDAPRGEESGSCESLMSRDRIVGSVPGLLDAISCGSTADINVAAEEESSVPNILTVCFRHLEAHGLHTLGIFRVSTSKKRIRQLREDFDCGKETTLDEEQCPHDVATLLKEYLRDLPDPLLCRDLYHAFIQTQRIRNRRLQFEALQHLIQLLPAANRDTLWALLCFLSIVAKHSSDSTDASGDPIAGNKMDSNNLATVFAPNILHCIKPGSSRDTSGDRPEDRIDVINVVRILIDNYQQLFSVSAELLDEIYVHLMDSHPEVLDQLLNKREDIAAADDSVDDLDSESNSAPWSPTQPTSDHTIEHVIQNLQTDSDGRGTPPEPRKIYSREEFLHEAAATGGPNVAMRIRHKERLRGSRRRRDDSVNRRRREEDSDRSSGSSISSAMTIISKFRGQKEEDATKTRSSSIESTSSLHNDNEITRVLRISDESQGIDRRKSTPYTLDKSGVITASLTIPVQQSQSLVLNVDDDIPYIEDDGRQQMTIGVMRSPMAPPRRRQRSISGSDSSAASTAQAITGSISFVQGYDSAVGSSVTFSSPVQNTPSSICSSIADAGVYSSPPSWASTPPTSPDSVHTSVNYIPDDNIQIPTRTRQSALQKTGSRDSPVLQKVSFTSASEIRQVKVPEIKSVPKEVTIHKITLPEVQKSISSSAIEIKERETSQKFTPSITNIGNAVLRSKTADFERIAKSDATNKAKPTTTPTGSAAVTPATATSATSSEKKKYTKRRYTDSRHQTRHIPDAESLEATNNVQISKKEIGTNVTAGPVYKRRELISSVPSK